MRQKQKAGRMLTIFLAVLCLSLVPVLAEDYNGDFNIGRIAAEGNSSNYSLTLFDEVPIGVIEGNSSNYTVTFEAFDYDAEPNIPPPPAEEEEEEEDGGSPSGGSTTFSGLPTYKPPVVDEREKDVSYGVLTSSKNKTIIVENKEKAVVLGEIEIKLVDNLTGEKKNVMIEIVQVGETKTRQESLSFFGYKYRMLEINHDDIKNNEIKSAKIAFSVLDTWLQENRLTKDDVLLFRYNEGEWQELKTIYEEANATHHFYSSLSPGLSSFMIGTREDVVEQTDSINIEDIANGAQETTEQTNEAGETEAEVQDEGDEKLSNPDELFGLKKAIIFLFLGVLLAVLVMGGVAFAMKHKHLHPSKHDEAEALVEEKPTEAPKEEKPKVEEPDFVDTLVGHVDAKAQEISEHVTKVAEEEHVQVPQEHVQVPQEHAQVQQEEVPQEQVLPQQSPINPRISMTSVRKSSAQSATDVDFILHSTKKEEASPQTEIAAPAELDFTGHEEESLTQYVKQVISAGYAKELYVKALLAKGWSEEQIHYCVNKVLEKQVELPSRIKTK